MSFKDDITVVKDATNTALVEADEFVIQGRLQSQAANGLESLVIDKADLSIMTIEEASAYIVTLGWVDIVSDRDSITVTI